MYSAPIVLFVYNRPQHTRRTLEALTANEFAKDSLLYIFADGPRKDANEQTLNNIQETRNILKQKQWCGEVIIAERNENKGLADSIVEGVTEVVNRHGRVIVLEDDIVTSTGFLKYMNEGLTLYENEEKVMEVCGYFYPVDPKWLPETFFYNMNSCWGWGTWKRAWDYYEHDINELYSKVVNAPFFNLKDFNKGHNNDVFTDLERNYENKLYTWAVRWHASIFLQQGFCLHPKISLVRNIGHDRSGIHCDVREEFQHQKTAKKIIVKKIKLIRENKRAIRLNEHYFRKVANAEINKTSLRDYYSRLKRIVIYFLFNRLKKINIPFRSKKLLITRFDAIGDYILFRNFIHELKAHPGWKQYKITLLGNVAFKDLATHADSRFIDEFIWINPRTLRFDYYNRCLLALRLKLKRFDILINPVHSREAVFDELFSFFGCKQTIGSGGDLAAFLSEHEKKECDKFYNKIISVPDNASFEFFRNRKFFNELMGLNKTVQLSMPYQQSNHVSKKAINVVVVPGAGAQFRQWRVEYFATLIKMINTIPDEEFRFHITGSVSDQKIAKTIIDNSVSGNIKDLTGQTSLAAVVDLIGSADLVISNETSAVHIAAATNTPVICISNGNHFGRFNPYPEEITNCVTTIYPFPHFYNTNGEVRQDLIAKYSYRSEVDINLINPKMVFNEAEKLINIIKSEKYKNSTLGHYKI